MDHLLSCLKFLSQQMRMYMAPGDLNLSNSYIGTAEAAPLNDSLPLKALNQ